MRLSFSVEYENEAGGDPPDKDPSSHTDDEEYGERGEEQSSRGKQKSFLLSTYASHHLKMEGITFYTEEFRIYNPRKHVSFF